MSRKAISWALRTWLPVVQATQPESQDHHCRPCVACGQIIRDLEPHSQKLLRSFAHPPDIGNCIHFDTGLTQGERGTPLVRKFTLGLPFRRANRFTGPLLKDRSRCLSCSPWWAWFRAKTTAGNRLTHVSSRSHQFPKKHLHFRKLTRNNPLAITGNLWNHEI